MKTEVLNKMLDQAKREVIQNELLVDFYKHEALSIEDKELRAKTLLKADQIQGTVDFNKRFIDYLNNTIQK